MDTTSLDLQTEKLIARRAIDLYLELREGATDQLSAIHAAVQTAYDELVDEAPQGRWQPVELVEPSTHYGRRYDLPITFKYIVGQIILWEGDVEMEGQLCKISYQLPDDLRLCRRVEE